MKLSRAITLTLVGEILVAGIALGIHGTTIEGLQFVTRYSGRLSLLLFALIFIGQQKNADWLQAALSPEYFLVFAVAHGIHLIELLSYVYLAGIELVPYRVAGGFIAYSLIFIMPWLHHQFTVQKFSADNYRRMGWVYAYYVWLIFFMTYLGRLRGQFQNAAPEVEHIIGMAILVVLLIWKTTTIFFSQSRPEKKQ
jgi:hypothetical protein